MPTTRCRAIVLARSGAAFCAGADFANARAPTATQRACGINPLYGEAIRLFVVR